MIKFIKRIDVNTLLVSLLVLTSQPCMANSNDIEEKIVHHINQHLQQSQALLEKTVNINSGTMNFSGVKAVGAAYATEFEELGFETLWVDGSEFNRAGHLVASYGNMGPKILMIGHHQKMNLGG